MRTAITVEEFVFVLNQDEDILLDIVKYQNGDVIYHGWKSDLRNHLENYDNYKNWFVQDMIATVQGFEMTIVETFEELED